MAHTFDKIIEDNGAVVSFVHAAAPHLCSPPPLPTVDVFALQIPPVTRIFMYLLVLITAVDCFSGEAIDAGSTFSLDWGRTVKVLTSIWSEVVVPAPTNRNTETCFPCRKPRRL